jgi:prepilin-type processing-associated H-X9-DG protein
MQATGAVLRHRRRANMAFAGGLSSLLLIYGAWIGWISLNVRG